jgi:hypothetical protein
MSTRAAAWLAWSLCALTPLLIACVVALAILNGTDVFSLTHLVAVALCALVGGVVATRRSDNPVGWILLGVGAIIALQEFALQYATYGLRIDPGSLPLARATAWLTSWLYVPGLVLLLSFLPLYFPNGRLISVRWRWIARLALIVAVVEPASIAFMPGSLREFNTVNPLGIEALRPVFSLFNDNVVQVLLFGVFFASAASLIIRFRPVHGEERQQIKWLTYAAVTLPVWFLINPLIEIVASPYMFNVVETTISSLLFAGIPIAVGVAILRYRLYDIDLLINRTLVYGSLTVMLALLYFGGVSAIQALFGALTGQEQQPQLAIVVSTLVIAALFNPLRRRIQSFIDRSFYRSKYDARKTLEAFSAKLRDETDLETLNGELVAVVRETMQPEHVSLWLRPHPVLKDKKKRAAIRESGRDEE